MASGPFFFSQPFNEPKRKYKFFVEFQGGENNHSLSYFFPNGEYQWFIKSCTKPSIKVEVTPREETISIFNTPVATRRINEGATWNPIAIKFVNPYSHTFKPAIQNLENTDDYRKAVDLDHFFSNVMSSINANFGGNFIVEAPAGTPKVFENDEYLLLEYENTLDAVKLIEFGQLPRKDRVAKALKELNATIAPQTKDKGTISNNSCKGTAAISAVCKFNKFFGSIKIWDLGNGYFTLDEAKKITDLEERIKKREPEVQSLDPNRNGRLDPTEAIAFINNDQRKSEKTKIFNMADTFPMGYWYLINPWIESVETGNYDYGSDDLQEYTLVIGYDSAKYFSLINTPEGDQVNKELLKLRQQTQT